MAVLKCKMCGGDLNITADAKIVECEYCGTTQTIPDGSDEKKTNLFNRANRLRMDNEFDKAAGVYESIVSEFPEEAEGYWGLVLCAYGIEYVDDAKTGKKIPTCHRTLTSSVMDDDNFVQACENADAVARGVYREEAKAIDRLQQLIIAVVENEEPYDVFICYKETDDITKQRTEDSLIAQDIYTELIKEGYKVFFSRVTLRDKAGTEYEPYIYAALKSAKIMLAIGTKFDYYDAVWVKNEWSRYISMMADDSSKHLIPCFKNLDAYDIPKEFKNLQALDMGEITFFKNLLDNVERFIPKATAAESITEHIKVVETVASSNASVVAPLLKRAFMFLEEGNLKSAEEYCEKVLDLDPECAEAYLGKLMVKLRVRKREALKDCENSFEGWNDYKKAVLFADDKLKAELEGYLAVIREKAMEVQYQAALAQMQKGEDTQIRREFSDAAEQFSKISGYKDADALAMQCREKIELLKCAFHKLLELHRIRSMRMTIAAGGNHIAALQQDGTVIAVGSNKAGECNVQAWEDIVAVCAGWRHTVGLKSDGTVIAVGDNEAGQCNVQAWENIVAVCAGENHTIGLKQDGTVVATGYNGYDNPCSVEEWADIVSVSTGVFHTLGLNSDGAVLTTERDDEEVEEWTDIVEIAAGGSHSVGLRVNGTVITKPSGIGSEYETETNTWTDIVAVCTGYTHIVGLKADGTVVAVGKNENGQCDVGDWTDIVAIAAEETYTAGLKSDGTVVICTSVEKFEQEDIRKLVNVALPATESTLESLLQREKIQAEERKVLMEARRREQQRIEKERAEEKRREEMRLQEQRAKYRQAGLCQHCGGEIKGLFVKKCVKCGKKKDY